MPRILLVDDSPVTQLMHKALLDQLGYTDYAIAEHGGIALERFIAEPFDLVITDYNMPEMDGRELTEYIRTQSWQNTVPVLMVTSEQNMGRLAAVERAGVSAICDKPFDAGSIRQLISDALNR